MDKVNIVFQVMDDTQKNPNWHNSKIIEILREEISVARANLHNGGYYQSR